MSRFPKDCWNKNCEHFHVTDMSVDDLLCTCDVSGMECDACNEDFSFAHCPLELDIKFSEKMSIKMANRVLGEYECNGKTIRECADLIANPKTNADRIRGMTDDELAEKLASHVRCDMCPRWPMKCEEKCTKYWLDWLKQEVKEGET